MNTTRHDHDKISPTEVIALANSAVLGIVLATNGPAPWPAARGASVVIVYAFLTSLALYAATHIGARALVTLGLLSTIAGAVISVPYALRTGWTATGGAGLFTLASALTSLGVGFIPHLLCVPLLQSTNPAARASTHCTEIRTPARQRAA